MNTDKNTRIHEEHEGARSERSLFICVHLCSSVVSKAFLLISLLGFGLAAGGVRADTVMLADGQPLVGELQPGATAGALGLVGVGRALVAGKGEGAAALG